MSASASRTDQQLLDHASNLRVGALIAGSLAVWTLVFGGMTAGDPSLPVDMFRYGLAACFIFAGLATGLGYRCHRALLLEKDRRIERLTIRVNRLTAEQAQCQTNDVPPEHRPAYPRAGR